MANSSGGAFIPRNAQLDGEPSGTMFGPRAIKVAVVRINGNALALMTSGIQAWQNPEDDAILVLRAVLDLTTAATGACTFDIGLTATSAATSSDTLLDGVDVNSAAAVFDSMNAALDSGANANAQKLAVGKWITIDEKTGDAEGSEAMLYIYYMKVVQP